MSRSAYLVAWWRRTWWTALMDDTVTGAECVQVIPPRDLREHVASETCWCEPRAELTERGPHGDRDIWMYVHNALDGRP